MAKTKKAERITAIRNMARTRYSCEGETEIDRNAKVSEGDDNGAYVQAWVWVDFTNTKLCRDKAHELCETHCPAEEVE